MSAASGLSAALPGLAAAMQQETEKHNEFVTSTALASLGGNQVASAYLQQLAIVKQATAAHAAAAAALRAEQEARKAFQDKLKAAGQTAQELFHGASNAARGFAQMASPEAFDTLTDSFKLVGMELGQYMIPAIVDAAMGAQEFARWLANLSPASKE
jgi:hypothetical protein